MRAKLGASMAAARRHVAALIKVHKLNEPFKSKDLLALMEFQPTKRAKPSEIKGFIKSKRPPYNRPCLYCIVQNDRLVDVSWVKAIRNLYGKLDKDTETRKRVVGAFRNEAFKGDMMRAARAEFTVGKCAECDKRCKLAIDHLGKPFAQILDEFLIKQKLALGSVEVKWREGVSCLQSHELSDKWRQFHDDNAILIGLCKKCNSSKGSSGYRSKC